MATLTKVAVEKFIDPDVGRLLEDLRSYEESLPFESDEASLIRVTRRDFEKAVKVPAELQAEIMRAEVLGHEAWVEARAKSDFAHFLPHLQKNVDLKFKYVECLDEGQPTPYDILLDDYEPKMKTSEVKACFDALKQELVPLIAAIRANQDAVSDAPLYGDFPADAQERFCWSVLDQLGASRDSWRLDPTVHPFASSNSTQDIRITTRYQPEFLQAALFGTMHEFGHGLYEHQISPTLERTPLCSGTSLALHESQSRMWENLVGRSRPFWHFMYPKTQAAFPQQLGNVSMESFYQAINKVQPSFIRVEADEATYALHIILRFEIEQEIIEGKLALKDLPEVWNARFKEYFGLDVPNDAQGVLQDVHWSGGMLGYFPTYALGSIISCQIWEKILAEIPDLYDQFSRGEFAPLREWLRVNVHQHGRKFTPAETLQRVVGSGIDVAPYMRYLQGKYGEIYSLG
jgi:carboxypeptidase Taq